MTHAGQGTVWVTTQRNRFERFERELNLKGVNIRWEHPPKNVKELAEWVNAKVSQKVLALILDPDPIDCLEELCHALKVNLTSVPIYWIRKNPDDVMVHQAIALGVDELISMDESINDLYGRLLLRKARCEERLCVETQVKELLLRESKNETALKQREEFLSVCAHDLRSPLGLVQSGLSMMGRTGEPPMSTFQMEIVTRAKRQAGVAIRLVDDLLDVMSLEQGLRPQYQLVALDSLLSDFYRDYELKAAEKGVRFHYENLVKEWRILADSDRLQQILQNLFTNALKYTDTGRNIYLRAAPFKGRRKSDPPYPMVIISLKDEGKGIPQKEKERIFDRFAQIKDYSRAEGRGLGLTVARQISKLHEGNVWVESEEGKGSTFNVLFPHAISRCKKVVESPQKLKRVLLVEADEQRRQTYAETLRAFGYEVVLAHDGVDGLALTYHWLPDAVILTPGLARLDEAEVATILRADELTRSVPIMIVFDQRMGNQRRYEPSLFVRVVKFPFTALDLERIFSSETERAA